MTTTVYYCTVWAFFSFLSGTCCYFIPLFTFSTQCCSETHEFLLNSNLQHSLWIPILLIILVIPMDAPLLWGRGLWSSESFVILKLSEVESYAGGNVFYQKEHPYKPGPGGRSRLSVSTNPFNMLRKHQKNPIPDWSLPGSTRTMSDMRVPGHLSTSEWNLQLYGHFTGV